MCFPKRKLHCFFLTSNTEALVGCYDFVASGVGFDGEIWTVHWIMVGCLLNTGSYTVTTLKTQRFVYAILGSMERFGSIAVWSNASSKYHKVL